MSALDVVRQSAGAIHNSVLFVQSKCFFLRNFYQGLHLIHNKFPNTNMGLILTMALAPYLHYDDLH